MRRCLDGLCLLLTLASHPLWAQGSAFDYEAREENLLVPPELLDGLELRSLNFSRGGRVTAVTGVVGQPLVYYFGAAGGGVWKTTNAGNSWESVSDGHLGSGSVGAIAVARSDPNVVYVGTGSACPRGNISSGDGVYRSTDAGKSFQRIGLEHSGQIGRIRIHPDDPDLLYVAALGQIFGPHEERGIYRSQDGGESWERVLFLSERTGFVDLAMDPTNPRNLYAAAWRVERKPWTLISGSEEGGLFKSTDGGDSWAPLTGGLPAGLVGRIGVAVSPANPERVWALVEAKGEAGGLYRSDDGGESFERLTGDARLRQRPWYYTHVHADPEDEHTVYVLNTGFFKSVDGGKSFTHRIEVPHGDNHDLWINPDDPRNMINGNDGGANVTYDGGDSWSWQMNQPTAEIYRVFVDEQWPYRVYGPQQDNSTISVSSTGVVAWNRLPPDWYAVGGCESGHIAVDPRDPDVVYAGCYGGNISRIDHRTGTSRQILAYPQLQLGQAPRDLRYRFQWNAPIRLSPHDPSILYHTSQVVHRSRDEGQSWEVISPDLTTNDQEQQDFTGGPITRDSTGVEVYNTIFAFEESPHRPGELWAGSDDGRLHVSRDGGTSWQELTPKQMPAGATINVIEHSAHDPDRVFLAAYRYRENDYRPYILRSDNGGKSWTSLADGQNGIPASHFTRAIREDPERRGLLYAGTEFGLYLSFDDGKHWQRLENNLPVTPVTDLRVHRRDLVIATQGRAFWVLDDLSPLHQLFDERREIADAPAWLFAPRPAYRGGPDPHLRFYFAAEPQEKATLEILDAGEEVLRTFTFEPGDEEEATDEDLPSAERRGTDKLAIEKGINTHRWNLRTEGLEAPEGVIHWGSAPGLAVVPGSYGLRLTAGEWSQTRAIDVGVWPALTASAEDLEAQHELGAEIGSRLEKLYAALERVRSVRSQAEDVIERVKRAGIEAEELAAASAALSERLTGIEERLTQVKSKSRQDPLNFPPMLDNQFVTLLAYVAAGDDRPTAGAYERLAGLAPQLETLLTELEGIVDEEVDAFNELVREHDPPALVVGPGP